MPEAQPGLFARAPPERAQRSGLTPGLRSWRPRVTHRAQRQNGLAVPAGARAFAVSWRLGRPPRRASPLPEGGKRGPLGVPRRAQPPPAAHPEKRRARGPAALPASGAVGERGRGNRGGGVTGRGGAGGGGAPSGRTGALRHGWVWIVVLFFLFVAFLGTKKKAQPFTPLHRHLRTRSPAAAA